MSRPTGLQPARSRRHPRVYAALQAKHESPSRNSVSRVDRNGPPGFPRGRLVSMATSSLFLDDHGALFGLCNRVGRRRCFFLVCVVFDHAFAVVDVPDVVFPVNPDRSPLSGICAPPSSFQAGRLPTRNTPPNARIRRASAVDSPATVDCSLSSLLPRLSLLDR
jgi:hypothetical protein